MVKATEEIHLVNMGRLQTLKATAEMYKWPKLVTLFDNWLHEEQEAWVTKQSTTCLT